MSQDFNQAVYDYLQKIPLGKVTTYGNIAKAIHHPKASRAVGNALHKNPNAQKYPCYKVVNAKGQLSTRYAFGGLTAQRLLLEQDGIEVLASKVDLKKYLFE